MTDIITHRRTIKPGQMNGQRIPDEYMQHLLALADWAPTHGNTEPWRFYIYAGPEKARSFCEAHAALYREDAGAAFDTAKYDKLLHMGDKASHIIIAVMKRGMLEKIPALEEIAATSAAIQNLLLGAAAMGIAAYWGSGGMILKPAMKTFLELGPDDVVLGALYLGYSEVVKQGVRQVPLAQKTHWM